MRKNCTPGSVRGPLGNWRSYRDEFIFCTGAYAERSIESTPKVILLDLKLPKVDGLEVLRRIKEDPRTQATPVVVLTSSREERDVVKSYRLGVNSYIVKPVDFEKFTEAVNQIGLYWLLLNQPPTYVGASPLNVGDLPTEGPL